MTDIILHDKEEREAERVKHIEVTLAPGTFWRLKDGGKTVYLMTDCKVHDGKVHTTVIARPPVEPNPVEIKFEHYRNGKAFNEYLSKDFLSLFEQVSEEKAEQIRKHELAQVQGQIEDLNRKVCDQQFLQNEAMGIFQEQHTKLEHKPEAESKPKASLPITQEANNQAIMGIETQKNLSVIITDVIQNYAKKIESKTMLVSCFMQEQAEVSLAQHKHIVKGVGKLNEKIETLRLYSGDDVHLHAIKDDGTPAPASEKIHFMQRLLYMDEESLINAFYADDEDRRGADHRNAEKFFENLTTDSKLLQRVCPFPKCVVSIQYRRRAMYREADKLSDAIVNAKMAEIDQESFLLIRNGENVFALFSPLKMLTRLFPSESEMDYAFNVWGNQFGQDKVTIDSLDFVDAMEKNEKIANRYMNLQLVIVGAYERSPEIFSPLLGETDTTVNLLDLRVQSEVAKYVYDDEKVLTNHDYLPVKQWMANNQGSIKPGSRVVLDGNSFDHDFAPGLSRYVSGRGSNSYYNDIAQLNDDSETFIVREEKGRPYIEANAVRTTYSEARGDEFTTKVYLKSENGDRLDWAFCVDTALLDELDYYLNDRGSREYYVDYISVVKKAYDILKAESPAIDHAIENLRKSLEHTDLETDKQTLFKAISHWRIAHKGKMPPLNENETGYGDFINEAIENLYHEKNDQVGAILTLCEEFGYIPLQICMDTKGNWTVYREVVDAEWDVIAPIASNLVARHKIKVLKKGLSFGEPSIITPSKISAKEQVKWKTDNEELFTLWFRDGYENPNEIYSGWSYEPFTKRFKGKWHVYHYDYKTIAGALGTITTGAELLSNTELGKFATESDISAIIAHWRKEVRKKGSSFGFVDAVIPFAMLGERIVCIRMDEEVLITWLFGEELAAGLLDMLEIYFTSTSYSISRMRKLLSMARQGFDLSELITKKFAKFEVMSWGYSFKYLKKAAGYKYPGGVHAPLIRTEYSLGNYGKVLTLDECRQVHTILKGKVDMKIIQEFGEEKK